MHAISRRTFVAAAAASFVAAPRAAERTGDDRELVIGQIIAVTGPLASITDDIVKSSQAWFDALNDKGGVHGRKVKLVTLDDGYVPDKSMKAARELIEERNAFALLNMTGTSNVASVAPMLDEAGVPLVGPFTGADSLRTGKRSLFHIRASYGDETEKIVQHLTTIGIPRVSVVSLDNGFGQDGLAGVARAMTKRGLKIHSSATMKPDGSDADRAVATLLATTPDVIVLVTTGKATVDFIQRYSAKRKGVKFYALSVMGTQSTLKALGPDGIGTVVTSVVPFPWSAAPVAREYRDAMARVKHPSISFVGMESFINAKVLTEGLRRAGPAPTRAKFVAALEALGKLDVGGFEVGFAKDNRQGSRFVDLTLVGAGEKFTR